MADRTFDEISRWVFRNVKKSDSTKCFRCGKELLGYDVRGFEHDGGWKTKRGLQWLYIQCPCTYQNSFEKMRISRSNDFSKIKDD